MAKCSEMLCTTNGQHLVAWNPLALCSISHIAGGEHLLPFAVLGKILCEVCWRQHGRDAKGQKWHL